jgi:hypothetical protein
MSRMSIVGVVLAVLAASGGCVRRTITITTEPQGTLVWLNDREVGRTPVEVDFKHYGTYDVRLERQGYEPMMTSGRANAPWWDTVGLDLLAELTLADLESRIEWHYVMTPLDDDHDALMNRAHELRKKGTEEKGTDPFSGSR